MAAMIRVALCLIFGASVMVGLTACKHPRQPPLPSGLPRDAVWVGGEDGGAFVLCRDVSKTEVRCTTWNESGSVWMKGRFRVVGTRPTNLGLPTAYDGVDGEHIFLANGGRLEVVAPPRPASVPSDAVWSGGPQCGAFMACSKQNERRFLCTVYDEEDGTVRSRGGYELRGDEGMGPHSNADLEESCAVKEWNISVRGGGLLVHERGDGG